MTTGTQQSLSFIKLPVRRARFCMHEKNDAATTSTRSNFRSLRHRLGEFAGLARDFKGSKIF
jgi:hypothetical protein